MTLSFCQNCSLEAPKRGADLTQQLHLPLVHQQLEHSHFSVTRLSDPQQRVDGVGRVGGVGHALYHALGSDRP